MSRPTLNINWEAQPWATRNTRQLADDLGCSPSAVAQYRAYYAPETVTPRGRPRRVDLSKVNFANHNEDIAKEHGCNPSVVRKWRSNHNLPRSPRRSNGRPRVYPRDRFDPRRSASENAKTMGCGYQLAWLILKQWRQQQQKGKAAK